MQLILGQSFGGEQIHRPRSWIVHQPLQYRQVVAQRFAAGGRRHYHHVPALGASLEGVRLVHVELGNAPRDQGFAQRRSNAGGDLSVLAFSCRLMPDGPNRRIRLGHPLLKARHRALDSFAAPRDSKRIRGCGKPKREVHRFIRLFFAKLTGRSSRCREQSSRRIMPIITMMGTTASRHGVNQPDVRLDRKVPYLRIDAVNVFVKDQDRSLEFYRNQLGFDLALDTRLPSGHRLVAVAPPDGATVLRLIAPEPDSEDYKLIGRSTPIVLLTEDVVGQYRDWSKRGVHFRYTPRLRRIKSHPHAPAPTSHRSGAACSRALKTSMATRSRWLDSMT